MADKVRALNVAARGLEMFLGPLEAACMRAIWANCHTSRRIWQYARDHYQTAKTEEIAYTSVTSTVYRLYTMGFLERTGDKHAGFNYTPIHTTEAAFVNAYIKQAITALLESYPRETGAVMIESLRASVQPRQLIER